MAASVFDKRPNVFFLATDTEAETDAANKGQAHAKRKTITVPRSVKAAALAAASKRHLHDSLERLAAERVSSCSVGFEATFAAIGRSAFAWAVQRQAIAKEWQP